jgi:5-methylcytosine-specific restriction endonuclease McrA
MSKPWYSYNGATRTRITAQVFTCYGTVCHLCLKPGADTVDHVIPRSRGGDDALENLRPAHASCNYARKDTDLAEWFRTHPVTIAPLPASRAW